MEWLDGVSVRETEHIDAMGFDRVVLAETLLRCLLQQMLVDGHFHVDPHPGNVLVLADGRIGLIDFGATARLDALQQTSVREMLFAINQQDPSLLRQAVLEVATVRGVLNDDQLERALARFMARHLRPGATPSAQMFNELLQLFFTFGLVLPAEFSSLFRAIVTLEGTITTLSPGYPVLTAAQGFAAELARDRMGADAMEEMARKELLKLVPVLRRLPRQVDRLATMAQRGDLTVRTSWLSTPSDVTALSRLVNRGVLAVLSLVVGLLSVLLLGIQGGPEFTGQTSLYEFFGYFGLFCCTVLVMRLLVAIFREGLN
jgi:ubiquinone biosynthesis protein